MKIILSTPFNPGDLDPGKTYPHVFIPRFTDANQGTNLSFDYEYGTVTTKTVSVPGIGLLGTPGNASVPVWTKGIGAPTRTALISGTAYLQMAYSAPLLNTDTTYNTLMRTLYNYLINTVGISGSISNS